MKEEIQMVKFTKDELEAVSQLINDDFGEALHSAFDKMYWHNQYVDLVANNYHMLLMEELLAKEYVYKMGDGSYGHKAINSQIENFLLERKAIEKVSQAEGTIEATIRIYITRKLLLSHLMWKMENRK